MNKKKKALLIVGGFIVFSFCITDVATALWVWTPKTKKFESVKDGGKDSAKAQAKFAKQQKDLRAQLKQWKILLKRFPKSLKAAEALFNIAKIYEKMNDFYQAHLYYKRLIEQYPFSEFFIDAIKREYQIGIRFTKSYDRKFWDVTKPIDNPAIQIFDLIVAAAPNSEYAVKSLYQKGLFLKKEGQIDEAISVFDRIIEEYPTSDLIDGAQYQKVLCLCKRAEQEKRDISVVDMAISGLNQFISLYPESEFVSQAKDWLVKLKEKKARRLLEIALFYKKLGKEDSMRLCLLLAKKVCPDGELKQEIERYIKAEKIK